ncbi:MAG TPA: polysaccharide biosynthesis/export family protein, partial [Pseudomonadota bacterium]|nr:polysaccharide biosynthesis/export family protein [Pseudomonadota bacterium]
MPLTSLRRSSFVALAVGYCALAFGCTPYIPRYDYEVEPDPTRLEYLIGPGDIIDIRQWKNPDVSGRVRVLPDGNISVPLLGQVQAAGLSARQLRDKLA